MEMKILSGPTSGELSSKMIEKLDLPSIKLESKFFTDGETYLRIDGEVENEDILLIENTYPNQEKRLLEIMLIASTLKEYKASKVYLFAPYLCYARADRRRLDKEVISHKITLELLYKSGVDSIITFNVHNREAFVSLVPELEKYDINALQSIKEYLREKIDAETVLVGPDKGVDSDLKSLSEELGTSYFCLEKYRNPKTHEITITDEGSNFEDKNIVLIDDVITSGGTALEASRLILSRKPKRLRFIVVHALAKPEIFSKFKQIGVSEVISTNTIIRPDIKQIDICFTASKFIKDKFL